MAADIGPKLISFTELTVQVDPNIISTVKFRILKSVLHAPGIHYIQAGLSRHSQITE